MPAANYAALAGSMPRTPLPAAGGGAQPKQQKPLSLASQAAGLVKGLPGGIFHLGKGLLQLAQGPTYESANKQVAAMQEAKASGKSFADQLAAMTRVKAPIVNETAASMSRTGGNLVDLASVPFGKQTMGGSHYGQAVKQGTILPVLVQDVGNVAIVGSGATKALGAGAEAAAASGSGMAPGLARAASAAEKVTGYANRIADAPARPYALALKGVGKAGAQAGELLGKTEWGAGQMAKLADWQAGRAQAGRVRELDQSLGKRPAYEEAKFAKVAAKTTNANFEALAKEAGVAPADLQHAHNLYQTGLGPVISQLEQIPDEVTREHAYNRVFGVEQKPSLATRELLANPDLMGKAEQAFDPLRKRITAQEKIKLETESPVRKTGMLSIEQLGHEPMQSRVDKLVELGHDPERLAQGPVEVAPGAYKPALLAGERLNATMSELGMAPQPSGLEALRAYADEARKLSKAKNPITASAGERGATMEALAARTQEAAAAGDMTAPKPGLEAPVTMEQLQSQGIFPKYVQGGYEDPNFAPGIGAPRSLQERTTFAEKQKKGGNVLKSNNRVAEQLARDAVSLHQNRAIGAIKGEFVRTPKALIEQEIAQLQAGPMDRPTELRIQDLQDRLARGHDLSSYMTERGYKSIANKAESGVTADSEFVPKGVAKTYKAITEPTSKGPVAKVYDKTTQAWKTLQLPLNPGWNVGNLFGNGTMAVVRGGMDPATLIEYSQKARKVLEQEAKTGESILPARLHGTSGVAEMVREGLSRDPQTKVGKIYDKTLGKVIDAGYAANEAVDNTGRAAMYMWLRDKGMSEEQAVQQTLRSMGDFSNLSPLEQQVKRALPFYAWQRHTAQMAYDMATKHPYRTAAVLDLANQGVNNQVTQKDQLRPDDPRSGLLNVGGNLFLPVANMNPFTNSVQPPFLSPTALAGSLNPIIKGAAAMGLDVNLQRGRMNTRPGYSDKNLQRYGGDESVFGTLNSNGQRQFGPMSLSEDARYLLGQGGAIGRGILGALEGDKVRYDTGVPMLKNGQPIQSENGRLQSAYKPLGLPIPYTINQQRVKDNSAKNATAYAKAQAKKAKAKKKKS